MSAHRAEAIQDLIVGLEAYELIPRASRTGHSAMSVSQHRVGFGGDFHSHRPFQSADDPRWIDIHSYLRTGKLWTKQYTKSLETKVVFALDCSRSMGMGDASKWETGICTFLALKALCNRAGFATEMYVFSRQGVKKVPTEHTNHADPTALDWLAAVRCRDKSSLAVLNDLRCEGETEIFVCSDFFWDGMYEQLDRFSLSNPFMGTFFRVLHAWDRSAPKGGYVDPESRGVGSLDTSDHASVQRALDRFLSRWPSHCRARHIETVDLDSSDLLSTLTEWLMFRTLSARAGGV